MLDLSGVVALLTVGPAAGLFAMTLAAVFHWVGLRALGRVDVSLGVVYVLGAAMGVVYRGMGASGSFWGDVTMGVNLGASCGFVVVGFLTLGLADQQERERVRVSA